MKLTLVVVGNTDSNYLQQGIDEYSKRIGHYINFEIRVLPYTKNRRNNDEILKKELNKLLSGGNQGREICLLDEKGEQVSSRQFAGFLEKKMVSGLKELIFLIGGPFGFPQEVYNIARSLLSLSKMTFTHQMVRLLFLEQIYRAFTILNGEPYHHD